jgi:hypothetical protein
MDIAFQLDINPKVLIIKPTEQSQIGETCMFDGHLHGVDGGLKAFIRETITQENIYELIDLWETEILSENMLATDDDIDMAIEEHLKIYLGEENYKDLRSDAPDFLNVRAKSKQTPGSRYQFTDKKGVIHFKTNSHRIPGVVYDQQVKLLDLDAVIQRFGGTRRPQEIVRMAIEGNIEVHCTDPSWKYWGFQYIGTKDDYSIVPEPRYPKVRNPNLKGSVCKHLDNVLYILPFQVSKVTADLRKLKRL